MVERDVPRLRGMLCDLPQQLFALREADEYGERDCRLFGSGEWFLLRDLYDARYALMFPSPRSRSNNDTRGWRAKAKELRVSHGTIGQRG